MIIPDTWAGRFDHLADYLDFTSPMVVAYLHAAKRQGTIGGASDEEFDIAVASVEATAAQEDLRALAEALRSHPQIDAALRGIAWTAEEDQT